MILWILLIVLAYLLGSVPFGYVVSRHLYGVNIQQIGSGNIGATNVYRNLGWGAAVLSLAGDLGKGIVPVMLARASGSGLQWAALVGLAAVLGHCFSIFLRFNGGKGVATTMAVLLALSPQMFLIFLIVWLVILLTQGRISLASLGAAAAAPVLIELLPEPKPGLLLFTWLAAVIIFVRHRENIDRLLAGTEKPLFDPLRLIGN